MAFREKGVLEEREGGRPVATILDRLGKVLMTQVPVSRGGYRELESTGGGSQETQNAPIFANYKAVTFPGLVVFVFGIWTGLQQTGAEWATSRWVPLSLCLLFGGCLTVLELLEDQVTSPERKFWGGLVGFGNCFVLFSAVIGTSSMGPAPSANRPTQTVAAPATEPKPAAAPTQNPSPR
jgi:hypothetical protein